MQTKPDLKTLDRILADAVETRLPLDLPFALMVSGGIDSTLIAHYARQKRPEAPGYFLGNSDAPDYDYIAQYAEISELDLHVVSIGSCKADTSELISDVISAAESFEPEMVRGSLCTYILTQRIHADGYKVALSGEGADEIFAGYPMLEMAFADGNASGSFVCDQHIDSMHRTCLQRIDRCGMRFGLEVREPFLDLAIADYALRLDSTDLVQQVNGSLRGKAPLRAVYDLYPDRLPSCIRDRTKMPLNQGAGFDVGRGGSPWATFAEDTIDDRALAEGQKRFAQFDIRTKEELLYLDALAARMDVFRVPHLADRTRLRFPGAKKHKDLSAYLVDD